MFSGCHTVHVVHDSVSAREQIALSNVVMSPEAVHELWSAIRLFLPPTSFLHRTSLINSLHCWTSVQEAVTAEEASAELSSTRCA